MHTFFANPDRIPTEQILSQSKFIKTNSLFSNLLPQLGGMVAVLNSTRQIVAINQSFQEFLKIKDVSDVIGLRLGEAVNCINANLEESGCGTSQVCITCTAVAAILKTLSQQKPHECISPTIRVSSQKKTDLFLNIQTGYLELNDENFVLLTMYDLNQVQFWSRLDYAFLNDSFSIVNNLHNRCYQLTQFDTSPQVNKIAHEILQMSFQLSNEFEIHNLLKKESYDSYQTTPGKIDITSFLEDLSMTFHTHISCHQKRIEIINQTARSHIRSDQALLFKIIGNMLQNALEASRPGDSVKLIAADRESSIKFTVWNQSFIEKKYQPRIFQKNFSTKSNIGRGLGCFMAKLLGEKCLHGHVNFSSEKKVGTLFWITLPASNPLPN